MSAWRKSIVRPLRSVTRPSSRILQQQGRDVGVRLFDFVEEHDAVRAPAHRFGELARLVVSGVSRRCAEQTRDRMRLGELGEIDAHERRFAAEERFGERLGKLGLSDAARPAEEKGAQRLARIVQTGARAPDGFGDRADRALLADHAPAQDAFEVEQTTGLHFGERRLRNAGPARDDRRHVGAADQRRLDGALICQRYRSGGFVHEVDRLIRQEAIGDVARRELRRRFDRVVVDGDVMVSRVAIAQPAQDRRSFARCVGSSTMTG